MPYTDRDIGKPCPFCGAKLVKSPKTNKVFCSDKCWLKQPPKSNSRQPQELTLDERVGSLADRVSKLERQFDSFTSNTIPIEEEQYNDYGR